MKIVALLLATLLVWANANEDDEHRNLKSGKGKRGGKSMKTISIKFTNLAFQQPLSGFFVLTHNKHAEPLFTLGAPASDALARLAEDGNPGPLVDMYTGMDGVGYAGTFTEGAPFFVGGSYVIEIPYSKKYPYVSVASMAINTNDCFVAINGMKLDSGDYIWGPGYDSGTEVNNELCSSIPGPACPADSGNEESGDGEGVVHVHRGFHGVGDLSEAGYDWRNPMILFEVM